MARVLQLMPQVLHYLELGRGTDEDIELAYMIAFTNTGNCAIIKRWCHFR
jgi:hypothetical protein